MQRCRACQTQLDLDAQFCHQCGQLRPPEAISELVIPDGLPIRRCAVCGEALPDDARFCGHCGSRQPARTLRLPDDEEHELSPLKRCPACGDESPIWARFCGQCREPFFSASGALAQQATLAGARSGGTSFFGAPVPSSGADAARPFAAPAGSRGSLPTAPGTLVRIQGEWLDPPAPTRPDRARPLKTLLAPTRARMLAAALLAIVLMGVGGFAALYLLTRPQPVIQVTSASYQGKTPAGSPASVFHIAGQDFTRGSLVTFLLDGFPAPGASTVTSDAQGAVHANLTVTDGWTFASHVITARDAAGYTTSSGARVVVLPRPVLTITSQYQRDGTPAGAAGVSVHLVGRWFAYNSPVTFLLDGGPTPGSQTAQSDGRGQVTADLTVTPDWVLGEHLLTASDAQGHLTQAGSPIVIVHQGEAGTPGPNGSPANDASFSLSVQLKYSSSGHTQNEQTTFIVTGHPDPTGGLVCGARDTGQPWTRTGQLYATNGQPTGLTYQETLTSICRGSYQGGQVSYTRTITSDRLTLSNGVTCVVKTPRSEQFDGAFSSPTSITGPWSRSASSATCSDGLPLTVPAALGTWTGAVA